MVNSVKYAMPDLNSAFFSSIGWIDFSSNFFLSSKQSQKIYNSIPGGYLIDFTISYESSDPTINLNAYVPPISNNYPFGTTGLKGINGYSILYPSEPSSSMNRNFKINISNIKITDSKGNQVCTYTMFVADAEVTLVIESFEVISDNLPWSQVIYLPQTNQSLSPRNPTVSGLGTNIVDVTGTSNTIGAITSPIFSCINPTNLTFNLTTYYIYRQGVALGVIINNQDSCPKNCENNITIPVCPETQSHFKFDSQYGKQNSSKPICIKLVQNDSIKYTSEKGNNFCGNLGNYALIHDTLYLTPFKCLVPYSADNLVFHVLYDDYNYYINLIFIYNPLSCKQQI